MPATTHNRSMEERSPSPSSEHIPKQLQSSLDELLLMLTNTPEDIGILLLLSLNEPNNKHPNNDNDDDTTISQQPQQQRRNITSLLRRTSVELFQHIETLHQSYANLRVQQRQSSSKKEHVHTVLSGLPKLYVSSIDDTTTHNTDATNTSMTTTMTDETAFLDAETIWGQVEIQNNALQMILKRSLRQLIVSTSLETNHHHHNNPRHSKTIQLLHDDPVDGNDDDDDDDDDEEDSDIVNDENDDQEENGDRENDHDKNAVSTDDDDDEETKRIRDRMKRTMDEMSDGDDESDSDDGDEDDDDDGSKRQSSSKAKGDNNDIADDIENDPAAVQLHDGFFNLQEMEEFADEEEEYLPNDAYGPITTTKDTSKKSNVDTRSFHQKQRDGDMATSNDTDSDDDDDDDDEALLFNTAKNDDPILQRRKKYRDDEDIEALYHLYDPPNNNDKDDDDDDEDDIIHMTAADLFGPPHRKFYHQWNQKTKHQRDNSDINDDYEDNMNDFNSSTRRTKSGWNEDDENNDENEIDNDNEDTGENNEESEDESDHEKHEIDDNERSDEVLPMKGNTLSKSKASQKLGGSKASSKLLELTEQLERDMLAEKPWQMKGETGSSARPVNSLLESTPEFEVATKLNPIITVAHTANLEEIIKQRIIAEDWDDIVPRELPDVGWLNKKNKGELPEVSQEKSKLGLGELYEREYLKKAIGYDVDAAEKLSSEDQLKNEMKSLFANVCSKLDALSNYHFTPRPVAGDTEVRPLTVPAMAMEEVLPIHVSDARGVAPEEVYGSNKRGRAAILRDTSEMDPIERKRLRNSKKSARRKVRQAKLADEKLISRLEPSLGLNNPYEKRKMREELSMARAGGRVTMGASDTNDKYGTSQTFFQRLQNEAEQTIRNGGVGDKTATAVAAATIGKSKSGKSSAYKL